MGEVWLALDRQLGQELVTKVVPADASPEMIDLLRHECRQARRLSHPNIVRVFDFHQCEGVSFITMEHVEGDTIESLRGAAVEKVVQALVPLAGALEHAHQAGVVHRDIKAANVLLDRAGQPRLMDFGIAGVLHPEEGDLLLEGGGSRYSVSPQQWMGEPSQASDDIYGLGALAYHLISGHPPFWPEASGERIRQEIPAPVDPERGVPPELQRLVAEMLEKSPADRPADMTMVRERLERIEAGWTLPMTRAPEIRATPVRITPPPRAESRRSKSDRGPDGSPGSRLRFWTTFAAFVLAGGLVLTVFLLLPGWVRQRNEPEGVHSSADSPMAEFPESEKNAAASGDGPSAEPGNHEDPGSGTDDVPGRTASGSGEERGAVSVPVVPAGREAVAARGEPATGSEPSSTVEFRQAMSEGLRALATGESAQAKEAFERALLLSPGSPEAVDGRGRAEEELRVTAIAQHSARAAEYEQQEDWSSALREYDAVVALDPTVRFAREGKTRAEARSQLAAQLESLVAHPEKLSDDEVLESAEELLVEARATEPPGPVLSEQIDRLAQHVAVASTPIRIELVSDNLTEVTVYRVGRLGRFNQQVLDLRPGTYTVVGKRPGYRDVRRRLTVQPGQSPEPLEVRCEEEI